MRSSWCSSSSRYNILSLARSSDATCHVQENDRLNDETGREIPGEARVGKKTGETAVAASVDGKDQDSCCSAKVLVEVRLEEEEDEDVGAHRRRIAALHRETAEECIKTNAGEEEEESAPVPVAEEEKEEEEPGVANAAAVTCPGQEAGAALSEPPAESPAEESPSAESAAARAAGELGGAVAEVDGEKATFLPFRADQDDAPSAVGDNAGDEEVPSSPTTATTPETYDEAAANTGVDTTADDDVYAATAAMTMTMTAQAKAGVDGGRGGGGQAGDGSGRVWTGSAGLGRIYSAGVWRVPGIWVGEDLGVWDVCRLISILFDSTAV